MLDRYFSNISFKSFHFRSCVMGYYEDIEWMRKAYFIFGILPIYNIPEKFKYRCWEMLYSILVYMMFLYMGVNFVTLPRFYSLLKLKNYDDLIYNFMFLSYSKIQFFFWISGWLAAPRFVALFKSWMTFEANVKKEIGKEISIKLKSRCKKITILCLFMSMLACFGQLLTLPTYTIKESLGFLHILTCGYCYMGFYHLNCYALCKTSEFMLREFKLKLWRWPTIGVLIKHKKCWNEISNLTQMTGKAFSFFNITFFLELCIDLVIAGYGNLLTIYYSSKNSILIDRNKMFGLIIAACISSNFLILIGSEAESVYEKIRDDYVDFLFDAGCRDYHPKVKQEIISFLDVIQHNRPVFVMADCIEINKRFLTTIIAVIVTYLVVLVQIKISVDTI